MPFFTRAAATMLSGVLSLSSWGLSFPNAGQPPTPPVSADVLAQYDAKYIGDTTDKVIYLTFDAGYENGCTEPILDALAAHNAPAAFFLVGNYLEQNPDLVRRMVAEGHTVGNHTYHHPDMSAIADEGSFTAELRGLEDLYAQITGDTLPHYYRPPRGEYSMENLAMAQKLGYRTVFWSLAYVDWEVDKQPEENAALEKILSRTHPGAVVLLHSTSTTNARILDRLLTAWEAAGYRLGTLDELYGDHMPTPAPNQSPWSASHLLSCCHKDQPCP